VMHERAMGVVWSCSCQTTVCLGGNPGYHDGELSGFSELVSDGLVYMCWCLLSGGLSWFDGSGGYMGVALFIECLVSAPILFSGVCV